MNREEIERLEKVTGKIEGLHREITLLAKKSSTDGLNNFKLRLVNGALAAANEILGDEHQPLEGFTEFEADDVPSNSDITVVLTIYLEELERYRSDLLTSSAGFHWYVFEDGTRLRAAEPKRLKVK
jgi:hypothetical protein